MKEIRKGFTAAQSLELIPQAVKIFRRVDTFYVWGYPFETMEDFNQTLFQMVTFRMLGGGFAKHVSFLPQTPIYMEWGKKAGGGSWNSARFAAGVCADGA